MRGFPNHCRARQPCVRVAPPRPRSIPVRFTLQSANKLLPAPADGDPSSTSSSSSFFALHPAGLFRRTTRSITTPTTTPGNISVHAQLAVLCTAPARANVAGLVMHANARALVHLRSISSASIATLRRVIYTHIGEYARDRSILYSIVIKSGKIMANTQDDYGGK